jgi:hypothetical protein
MRATILPWIQSGLVAWRGRGRSHRPVVPHGRAPAGGSLRIGRRVLIGGCLSLVSAFVWLRLPFSSGSSTAHGEARALLRLLGGILPDMGAARTVGEIYLRQHSGEGGRARLLYLLFGDGFAPAPPTIVRWLAERRAREFLSEDVVIVDGWLFSRSEARLCALVNLCVAPA